MGIDPLHEAFGRFLDDNNETEFLKSVLEYGGIAPASELDCPTAHRICDVQLSGVDYRVVRVADPDDRATRLYVYKTESPSLSEPGVPFRLEGEALWRWIADELETPTDGPVDWSRYDPSLRDHA